MKLHRRFALLWALVVCLLIGHNAWLWGGGRVVPDTDILALLPVQERDPVLQQSFTNMVDAAQQRVVVLVGAPDWDGAVRAANAYKAELATRPDLLSATVLGKDTESDWLAPFQQHALGLMSATQEAQLATEPPQFWADAALGRLYSAFSGPKLGAFRDDPFGLFGGWVQERAQETPVRPRDGHLFVGTKGTQYVLLPLVLKAPAFALSTQRAVLPLLERAAGAARAATPGAEIISAGVVLHAAAAGAQAENEVSTIGIGSLIGIVLLTWLTFHSVKPIGLILLSIGVGFLGALSVCLLLFGRIHLLTLVFGASLIGVAQDYGIYYLCNRLSADPALDSVRLLRRLMPGLLLTVVAAVIGYLGLALTPFPGLRHMAVFSALGLVFAWVTVLAWFPQLVSSGSLRRGALGARYAGGVARWPRLGRNKGSAVALVLVLLVAGAGWSRLGVNDDIRSLQTPPPHLVADQIKLSRLLDAPTPVQYFLVRGASGEQVLQREEALKRRLDPLVAAHRLSGYQAISNWVPSVQAQTARRALVHDKLLADGGPLQLVAGQIGEDAAWVAATRAHLERATGSLTPEQFLAAPAGEPWRHLWLGQQGEVFASIVAVRGLGRAGIDPVRHAGDQLEGVQWVDKVGEISSVLGRYRMVMAWVVAGAYVLVLALLWPRYGRHAWRALAPTALASILTVGLFGLAGQPLQLFHVLALMLLLGVGVDYGIFMQESRGKDGATAWLAIGLSAANTILSFGLLGLSKTPALQAFGLTMLAGTALVWMIVPCFALAKEQQDA